MTIVARVVQFLVTGGFVGLAAVSLRDWLRNRDRARGLISLTIGLLAFVSVLGRVWPAGTGRPRAVGDVSIVAFLASGYCLLLLRDTFLPLRAGVRRAASGVIAVVALLGVVTRLPGGDQAVFTGFQLAVVTLIIGVWSACILEPAVRFWMLAGSRPVMQRARMRALGLGYAGIALILLIAVGAAGSHAGDRVQILLQILSLAMVPLLYVSLAPPPAMRRRWRAREEDSLRRATSDLLLSSPDEETLALGVLRWSMRLTGADGGVVVDADARVLARETPPGGGGEEIFDALRASRVARTELLPTVPKRRAIVVPLPFSSGTGAVGLVAGPFAPVFSGDEVEMLGAFAAAATAALDRVRLVSDLRMQTELYETLLRGLSDLGEGVVIISGSGAPVYANTAFCEMSGYPEDEIESMPSVFDIVPSGEREVLMARLRDRMGGEAVVDRYDSVIIHKSGRHVDIDVSVKSLVIGDRVEVMAVVRDVTARRQAQERLRQSEEQWRTLAENVPDTILTCDPSGRVTFINRIFPGFEAAGVLGRSIFDLVDLEDVPLVRQSLEGVVQRGEATSFEIRGPGPEGATVWYAGRATPVHRDGAVVAVTVIATDITEHKRIEDTLRESREKFAEAYERERAAAEHLRTLDEMKNSFLAAVSHELRTPLTSVLGFAATLERGGERLTSEERSEVTRRLEVNAQKLHRLLGDLLDLDRLRRGILEPIRRSTDMTELVRRVIEEVSGWAERRIDLRAERVVLAVDAPKVERIVENLISNAMRHTPPGSPVWVRLHAQDGGVLIAIDDAGPGIPADMREAIFEPFRQGPYVAAHSPGVGVGLSLVAQFTELHGGRVWVEDREGGGSSFRVWLPGEGRGEPEEGQNRAS